MFLGGFPKRIWEQAYWEGVSEAGDTTPEALEVKIRETLASPDTSDWLRTALTQSTIRSRHARDRREERECLGKEADR